MRGAKKKWYLLILGGLGVALVVDRAFLGSTAQPRQAEAEPGLYDDPVNAQGQPLQMLKVEVAPFPKLLTDSNAVLRDPFAMTPSVQRQLQVATEETNNQVTAGQGPITAEQFAGNHQLSAVMRVDGEWLAIIDDTLMALGQRIDGCVITGIDERSIQAKCGRQSVRLVIQEPLERK